MRSATESSFSFGTVGEGVLDFPRICSGRTCRIELLAGKPPESSALLCEQLPK
jgi:hypothetical protein